MDCAQSSSNKDETTKDAIDTKPDSVMQEEEEPKKESTSDEKKNGDSMNIESEKKTDESKESSTEAKNGCGQSVKTDDTDNDNKRSVDGNKLWDHSDRRVMVCNVLKFINNKDVPKLVKKWLSSMEDPNSIELTQWRKAPNATWVILTCKTEQMAQKLISHINDNKLTNGKGKELIASIAKKSQGGKRERDTNGNNNNDDEQPQRKRQATGPMTDDQVRDKLTPLWRMKYEDQVNEKTRRMIKQCSQKICQQVKKKFNQLAREAKRNPNRKKVELYSWLTTRRAMEVKDVIPSPKQHAYRNKSEFTFGYRQEENDDNNNKDDKNDSNNNNNIKKQIPSVGFMAAGWSGGVSRPHVCQNVPWEACALADIFEEFLRDSPIPPYEPRQHVGLWRILTIRSSRRTKECMIIVQHAPPTGGATGAQKEDYTEIFETEKKRLVTMLIDKDLPYVKRPLEDIEDTHYPLRVTSIFFQEYAGLSSPPPEHPVQHAYGKKYLTEKLGDCEFQISPGAFFQVNTECAEILYQLVVDKIKEVSPSNSLLFDVCCGTGSIGLTCKKQGAISSVIGVDISKPAIDDAIANAKLNNLENDVRFISSKAEHVMGKETYELTKKSKDEEENNSTPTTPAVIAVVDPAREGLHQDVLRALRSTEMIKRIVYVSCNPIGSLINDAVSLCQPPTKRYLGNPFRPTYVQPVDMFPLSDHCEMVMVFDRLTHDGKDQETPIKKQQEQSVDEENQKTS